MTIKQKALALLELNNCSYEKFYHRSQNSFDIVIFRKDFNAFDSGLHDLVCRNWKQVIESIYCNIDHFKSII